jgi:hypothetical protein
MSELTDRIRKTGEEKAEAKKDARVADLVRQSNPEASDEDVDSEVIRAMARRKVMQAESGRDSQG